MQKDKKASKKDNTSKKDSGEIGHLKSRRSALKKLVTNLGNQPNPPDKPSSRQETS